MKDFLLNIWKPENFHGFGRNDNYFEGWFFKMADSSRLNTIAVIPGIYKSKDPSRAHSFIQILNGSRNESFYIKYPAEEFRSEKDRFDIKIGKSRFCGDFMNLQIRDENLVLNGRCDFINKFPWPVKLLSPGAMGWYSFVPFMECNHGVLSLDHSLSGALNYNGSEINFDGGRGYIEKDWGTSFPSSYVWMQSNHFNEPNVCLSASVAKIPWRGNWFRGFLIGFLYNDQLIRFTTYTGAAIKYLKIEKDFVEFTVENKRYTLLARAERTPGVMIHGPYDNQMVKTVSESLNSEIYVRLSQKKNGNVLFEGTGTNAGLDVNGTLDEIIG